MIPFNKSPVVGDEIDLISEAIKSKKLSGDGYYSRKSESYIENITRCSKALLTPSCTAALELAALLLDLQEGDEVIVPSYTFVSTANAFALRGVNVVFVDVIKETMNIDPVCIRAAITPKTKAIVPVHYAGVACDMDEIMSISKEYNLYVVEDAAQAIGSFYKGKPLGSIGHFGAFSFHETKNVTSGGEGGALLINDESFIDRAEVIREKGTNRKQFFRGAIDKYSWVDIGSSYLPSEIQAAYLYAQLSNLDMINGRRVKIWERYLELLEPLFISGCLTPPFVPEYATKNGHMFYVKCTCLELRSKLIQFLKMNSILATFHYVPLHSSDKGRKCGVFQGNDVYTTSESQKLVRLPLYYCMSDEEVDKVCAKIYEFFETTQSPVREN